MSARSQLGATRLLRVYALLSHDGVGCGNEGGKEERKRAWRNGRRNGLERHLSAQRETADAELLKFGETFHMAIPSQALNGEGVETRRAAPTANATVKG